MLTYHSYITQDPCANRSDDSIFKMESEEILPTQLCLRHCTVHACLESKKSIEDDGNGRIGNHARQHISKDKTDNRAVQSSHLFDTYFLLNRFLLSN